jgi:acetolactate synthase-1/2/3 large subunit
MEAKCIQISETPSETCLMVPTDLEIIGNPGTVVRQMIGVAKKLVKKAPEREEWLKFLAESRSAVAERTAKEVKENWKNVPLHPAVVGQEVANFLDKSARDATIIFDSFTGTAFFTDKLTARFAGQVLDCAEQGGVGHGIGMGIGAQLARPGKPVLVYMGDLGMGVGGMDIETAVRYKLPVVYLVNCNGIAMAGTQKVWFEKTKLFRNGTPWGFLPNIRYDKMFEPLGVHAENVVKSDEIRPALERAFNSGKTAVVNVITDDVTPHPITVGPISAVMTAALPREMIPEWGKQLYAKFGM